MKGEGVASAAIGVIAKDIFRLITSPSAVRYIVTVEAVANSLSTHDRHWQYEIGSIHINLNGLDQTIYLLQTTKHE